MNYKEMLKIELFYKLLSKSMSILKSISVLFVFGFSGVLDAHFFSLSIIGMVLSVPIIIELLYLKNIKIFLEEKDFDGISNLFYKSIFVTILGLISINIIFYFFQDDITIHNTIVLSCWSILFVSNAFIILLFRLMLNYKIIGKYFFFTPVLILLLAILINVFFNIKQELILSFSFLFSEIMLSTYLCFKLPIKRILRFNLLYFKFNYKKEVIIDIFYSFSLISSVYIIDLTDKYFAYQLGNGYTTILIYGSLFPLAIRQALDIKSVFYHKLQYSNSIKNDIKLLVTTIIWLLIIIFPLVVIFFILSYFVNYSLLKDITQISFEQFIDLVNVFKIYILILPVYIIWDMLYRVYYKNRQLEKLMKIMFFGLLINVLMNYIFIYNFKMTSNGIALSTFIVLFYYCTVASVQLFKNKNKEKFL